MLYRREDKLFAHSSPRLAGWLLYCSAGSICKMKRNTHVFIPEQQFRLLSGEDNLGCYQVSSR